MENKEAMTVFPLVSTEREKGNGPKLRYAYEVWKVLKVFSFVLKFFIDCAKWYHPPRVRKVGGGHSVFSNTREILQAEIKI